MYCTARHDVNRSTIVTKDRSSLSMRPGLIFLEISVRELNFLQQACCIDT